MILILLLYTHVWPPTPGVWLAIIICCSKIILNISSYEECSCATLIHNGLMVINEAIVLSRWADSWTVGGSDGFNPRAR